jgi:hypothetical protein
VRRHVPIEVGRRRQIAKGLLLEDGHPRHLRDDGRYLTSRSSPFVIGVMLGMIGQHKKIVWIYSSMIFKDLI